MKKFMLILTLITLTSFSFANDNDLAKAQKQTLRCTKKLLNKKVGGIHSVSMALEVLNRLFIVDKLSTDQYEVNEIALFNCREYLYETGRNRQITEAQQLAAVEELTEEGIISNKTQEILRSMIIGSTNKTIFKSLNL